MIHDASSVFVLEKSCRICTQGGPLPVAVVTQMVELIQTLTDMAIPLPIPGQDGGIILRLNPDMPATGPQWQSAESYRLEVSATRITLTARTAHGLSNAIHTLSQLLLRDADGQWHIPAVIIDDHPRFRWRGLMLDCGRHLFTVDEICRLLDLMALYKFNTFHWHLTEDQGWRIQVNKYPRLTEIGAWRSQSPVMGNPDIGDGQPYGGFYTHADIRRVVAHAANRFITVVPEIEMPGHSTAAIAAYPWLGNDDIPGWVAPAVSNNLGIHEMTLCPRETTFNFIEAIFDEILPLFPGAYVHIGGDEAPKNQWRQSPSTQEVMRRQGLKDEHELQAWFLRRVEQMLIARGKRLIGWDEIQEGGLSSTASMMVWRDWSWASLALQHGNDIVMAPTSHTYFDYDPQRLPLQTVCDFEPIPPGTPAGQVGQVLGCQGQIWTEYIGSQAKLEYMAFPRALALAEAAWTPPQLRDKEGFATRLQQHRHLMDRLKVNYRLEDGAPAQADAIMHRVPRPRV